MKQISEINTNPRQWDKDDVEAVKAYCKANGGKGIEIIPSDGVSPVFADLWPCGGLSVYFYRGAMKTVFYFDIDFSIA